MSSSYEGTINSVKHGLWVQDGVVNLRVDFKNYSQFKPYFDHFKIAKADGTILTGKGYTGNPYKIDENNTGYHVAFKCYTGDMNFEPVFKATLSDNLNPEKTNQTVIDLFAGKANPEITLTRNTTADLWNTICLPFKPTASQLKQMFGDGVEIQSFSGVEKQDGNILLEFSKLSSLDDFEAGVPYLVKPSQAMTEPIELGQIEFTAATPSSVTYSLGGTNYTFQGIYDSHEVQKDNKNILFLSSNNNQSCLAYPNVTNSIKPFRCYFQLSGLTVSMSNMGVTFGKDEVTTVPSLPVGHDRDVTGTQKIYTIDGRFVGCSIKGLKKGLYIQNGKKIVID